MIYLVSFAPVFVYSLLIYWLVSPASDRRHINLFFCVLMGFFSALVALAIEYLWNLFLGDFIASHRSLIFFESFVGVGAIEEAAKWVWLVFIINSWRSFTRYSDGILYACGIAAGFNLVEASLYIITDGTLMSSIIRSFSAVPVHFLFAILMGFFWSRYTLEQPKFFWISLLIPVLLHGLYDFFILQQYTELLIGGAILVFIGSLSLSIWVCRSAMRADRVRQIGDVI
ncbi:MAG: PrsW family glutamic-type intramembrane protease [Saprospiraceae bacterium]